jgi:hypothetical protein
LTECHPHLEGVMNLNLLKGFLTETSDASA